MAKTTRDKPKKDTDTGPILVQEPPDEPEILQESDTEPEVAEESLPINDPRRIPPQQTFKVEEESIFWDWLGQFPDPENVDLYGYRLFPVIKVLPPIDWNSEEPPPTNIFKIKGLITQETKAIANREWLRNTWGSGEYHLRVLDRRLKRNQNRQICKAKVDINEWDTHLPVLNDWSELVPVERNKWIINRLCKEKVIKRNPEGGFMAYQDGQQQQNGAGTTDPGALLDKTVNLAQKLAQTMQPKESQSAFSGKDIVDLIKSQAAQHDPQKVIDAAKGLVEISRPPEDKDGKTILALLLAQMEQQRKEAADQRKEAAADAAASRSREFELLKDMLTKANATPPAPPADPLRDLAMKMLEKRLEKMDETPAAETAAERQSRMNGTQELIVEVTKHVAPVLEKALGLISIGMTAKQQQPQPRQAAAPKPDAPAVEQAPAPQVQQQTQEPPPEQPTMEDAQKQILNFVLGTATPTLRNYLENRDGEDFADWFCAATFTLPGVPPPFNALPGADALKFAKQIGREAIMEAYKKNPGLYQQIAPNTEAEEKFIRFLDEFLAYDPEKEEEEAE